MSTGHHVGHGMSCSKKLYAVMSSSQNANSAVLISRESHMRLLNLTSRGFATYSRSSVANKQSSFQTHHRIHQVCGSAVGALSFYTGESNVLYRSLFAHVKLRIPLQVLTSAPPAISSKLGRITGPFRVLAVSPEGSFSAKGYSSAEAAEYEDMQKPVCCDPGTHHCHAHSVSAQSPAGLPKAGCLLLRIAQTVGGCISHMLQLQLQVWL